MPGPPRGRVQLRDVTGSDLDVFFAHQQDDEANWMAGFTADDPSNDETFRAHWAKIRSDASVRNQTILFEGQVAGYVAFFELLGKPSIAYWVGRELWGRGIATEAVQQFLQQLPHRPLYARVASDNLGSIRVLEKTGFVLTGSERAFANARGEEIEELVFRGTEP